ncbi:MAG: tetratricopeptide repeat protein, partial [bacterium]
MVTEPTTQDEIPVGDPDDRRAFEAREEQLFLEGRWEDLAGLYRRRLAASSVAADVSLQIPLLLRLAQVYEERILDPIAASETYWKLARLDPGHRPALRQLRGLHERAGQWDLVLQIAEIEGQAEMSPYERAAFEAELGRIWHEELSDAEEAMRAYERALAADPDHPAALQALADLHRRADRPEAAVALLERLTVRLRGPERAPAWIALGTLHAGPLGDPARAAVCFESALEDDPFQTVAAEWALLLATAAEDWPSVAQLLERRFDLASGARHRAAIAVEASQLQLFQLGSTAGARAWVDRAVELAPDDPAVLLARADVERADDDPRALLETLGRLCAQEQMPPSRALLWESARLHARFGQPRAALDALERARARPGPAGGTDRVEESERLALQADCLRQLGEAAELAELLETWTAIESDAGGSGSGSGDGGSSGSGDGDGGRVSRLHELARLYEEDLGDDDSAHGAWQRAFDLDPTGTEALDALERIHRKRDDPEALRALFETALEHLGASAPAELSAKLGTLLLEGFADLPAARVRLEAALEQSPGCRPALATLQRIAERIAEESGEPDLLLDLCAKEVENGVDETRMAEIVATVAPILEARGRLEEALEWATRWRRSAPGDRRPLALVADLAERLGRPDLELEARRALVRLQTGVQKSASLRRVAALHSQTGADEAAAQALREANASQPGELETVTALCDAYRRLERPRELVQALRQKLELLPLEAQSDTLEELAQRLQDPLGDLAAATVVRWRLIELPRPPEGAEQALETLLEEAGRYAELVQRLDERRERLGDDSEEALELDRRRARLRLDALGRSEEAARILAGLHARHPEDPELLDDLERALRVSDDARGLCALLEERAGREPDETRRLAMHFERASLLEESLGEPLGACDLLEACTRESTSATLAREACDRLEELLESLGQWRRLRDLLLRRCDDGLPEDEECALRERIARLSAQRLQDLEHCAEQTEIVVRLAPTRLSAWQTLQTLYGGDLERPGDFLRATEGELAQSPPESRELTLRVAAARLLLDDERRPADRERAEAHAHHARVLEIDPGHGEAAEALADHHEREGRPQAAARVLRMRLESDPDASGPETDALRLRLARIHSEELGQPERARPLLEAARLATGPCESIDESLAEIHLRTGDDEALAALCRERLDSTSDSPSSLPWRVRLAASEQRLGRLEDAARSYRAALIDSPDDREIEQALIAIYRALEEPEPLVELLEKRLRHASADESIALRLELATWHAEALGAPREALVQLERLLEIHPGHHEALDRALALSESLGDVPARLDLLERALALPRPGAQRARLLEQRGHLFAESTEQVERA